jgi:hypothetical protein
VIITAPKEVATPMITTARNSKMKLKLQDDDDEEENTPIIQLKKPPLNFE